MRVFLDTNVLVSAFVARGLCADVLRAVLAEHELVLGEVVLDELRRVLTQKLKAPEQLVEEILAFLETQPVQRKPRSRPTIRISDEADLWVLGSAIAARADVLVTGDSDLLDVANQVSDVLITDPRGFWNLSRKRPKK